MELSEIKQYKIKIVLPGTKNDDIFIHPITQINWDCEGKISSISYDRGNGYGAYTYYNRNGRFFNSHGNVEVFIIE